MTNADYVAIALSPALIMALVGSLVFFLIEVFYVGQYTARVNYVFALFVFATVLIGRISIETGADRAALFALPLGVAMFLVLAKFVEHASPYSHLINIALLGIVWWSAHKLTWDCTLIDDSEDASGEGLMQRIGADELAEEQAETSKNNELLAVEDAKRKKRPHTPGLWVLYFSLAALPLFGIGQKWIPSSDVGRRQYAFGLLAIYVAAGLALLVTTSFLGLRRYLRQRRVEMPTPMAATWVVTGAVLIVVVMLLAALIPRPHAEYAISQVPWQVGAPSDLASSRNSFGNEGTEDEDAEEGTRKVTNEETDPDATAKREGDNPTATSDEGEKQTNGESGEEGQESSDDQSQQGENSQVGENSESESEASEQGETTSEADVKRAESNEDAQNPETENSQASTPESSETDPESTDDSASESQTSSPRPSTSLSDLVPRFGGLTGILKLLFYAIITLVLLFLVWQNRERIAAAIRDLIRQIRQFLAQLFGGARAKPTSDVDGETQKSKSPPLRPFASYADPFASGQMHSMPADEVVRYTFEAFEAWARERGHPRSPDQTPLELIRRAVPAESPLLTEAHLLAKLYNEAAYAPKNVSTSSVEQLAQLWTLMRQSQQTPVESVS